MAFRSSSSRFPPIILFAVTSERCHHQDDERYAEADRCWYARGRAMTIEEGVAFALGSTQQAKPTPAVNHEPPPALTGRQLEIARLIADGLSNKQIAARLFLSERTVETHITNMLNKLGLNSRVQISRWIDQ